MKHALLIIGEQIKQNEALLEYIFRYYKQYFHALGDVIFSPKNNKDLPFLIDSLSSKYNVLSIFAHKSSFPVVSKLIATLTENDMELKSSMIIPCHAIDTSPGSYRILIGTCEINVLQVSENEKLPKILYSTKSNEEIFHAIGIDQDSFKTLLSPLEKTYKVSLEFIPLCENWLKVIVKENEFGNIKSFLKEVADFFDGKIFIAKDPFLHLISTLSRLEKTISFAESCTGGLLSSSLTEKSGASNVFQGGLVTYSNAIKSSWLGVSSSVLQTYGAVSEESIKEMLEGALEASKSDFVIVTSGIAGPLGGSKEKPVGTVFVGVASKSGRFSVERFLFSGDRNYIQKQSVLQSLRMLFTLESQIFMKL